ncbi:MAG TPA: DinB family protein [Acidimicrobiales bacterium]|nr:DinB family protein [Acidimicrobiales bacterium]
MPAPEGILDRLRATALDLVSLVRGSDEAVLRKAPAGGGWPAATVVAHLADAEQVHGVRARMMLTSNRPWLTSFDEDGWAERFAPLEPDTREVLQRWRVLREANIRLFEALDDDEWQREGVHDTKGTQTVAGLARIMADHDREHLAQIRQALAG